MWFQAWENVCVDELIRKYLARESACKHLRRQHLWSESTAASPPGLQTGKPVTVSVPTTSLFLQGRGSTSRRTAMVYGTAGKKREQAGNPHRSTGRAITIKHNGCFQPVYLSVNPRYALHFNVIMHIHLFLNYRLYPPIVTNFSVLITQTFDYF